MSDNMHDLNKQILEKNLALSALCHRDNYERVKIQQIESELDHLLYKYYKYFKCKCSKILSVSAPSV
ncbi:MAG: hypothetical protein N3B21_18905 [Clostridia bacterium]|nr:hypothetical protein [Clostridia bacterium]